MISAFGFSYVVCSCFYSVSAHITPLLIVVPAHKRIANGFPVFAKGLDVDILRTSATVGNMTFCRGGGGGLVVGQICGF
jgi:hypothetical protein